MDNTDLIRQLFLFKNTDFDTVDRQFHMIDDMREIKYKCGETILTSEEKPCGIGIISEGTAEISTSARLKSPTLRTLSVGDAFGAASLFSTDGGYFTTVIAKSHCTVLYIKTETVIKLCESFPVIAINYIQFLSDRIVFLNKKVSTFTAQSIDAKIAYFILQLTDGKAGYGKLPFSYSVLAENLGIGRASLYRVLDSLSDKGIISRDSKSITVIQPNKLINMLK